MDNLDYVAVADSFGSRSNTISFDWLTFTGKSLDPDFYFSLLGLDRSHFEVIDKYMNGYAHRYYCEGISIMYGGHDDSMGCCVNISGSGCRFFEESSKYDWKELISLLVSSDSFHVTRLDVAYDDYTGVLDLSVLRSFVDSGSFVSRCRSWSVTYGSTGTTLYFGSRKSDFMIRIYDKWAEQHKQGEGHWVRLEMQMRDKHATEYLKKSLSMPAGELFCGVLFNYLRFVDLDDSNKSRCSVASFWRIFCDGVKRIRLWTKRGIVVTIDKLADYVVRQAGNAFWTVAHCLGLEYTYTLIRNRATDLPDKYRRVIDEYNC